MSLEKSKENESAGRETSRKIRVSIPEKIVDLINKEMDYFKVSSDKFFNALILEFGFNKLPEKEMDEEVYGKKEVLLFNLKIKNELFNDMMFEEKNATVTSFVGRIVAKYFSLSPTQREQIILSDMFNTLELVIKKKTKLKIYYDNKAININPLKLSKSKETGYNVLVAKEGSYPVAELEILKVEKSFYAGMLIMFGALEYKATLALNEILHNGAMLIDTTPKVGKIIAAAGGTLLVGSVATNTVAEKVQEKKEYVKVVKRMQIIRKKQFVTKLVRKRSELQVADATINELAFQELQPSEMILEKATTFEREEQKIPYIVTIKIPKRRDKVETKKKLIRKNLESVVSESDDDVKKTKTEEMYKNLDGFST